MSQADISWTEDPPFQSFINLIMIRTIMIMMMTITILMIIVMIIMIMMIVAGGLLVVRRPSVPVLHRGRHRVQLPAHGRLCMYT